MTPLLLRIVIKHTVIIIIQIAMTILSRAAVRVPAEKVSSKNNLSVFKNKIKEAARLVLLKITYHSQIQLIILTHRYNKIIMLMLKVIQIRKSNAILEAFENFIVFNCIWFAMLFF